jgi:hypothetical protein
VPEELVRVLTTSSVPESEIARGLLEDEGIPVLLKGEGEGPYRIGPVHLFVPAWLEVRARLILAAPSEPLEDDEVERPLGVERGDEPPAPGHLEEDR